MKSKILLILSFFSFYNYSTGQNQSPQILKNEIRIRPFILENQVKSLESFISENVAKTEIFDSRFFRLVRFEKVLSKAQKNHWRPVEFNLKATFHTILIWFHFRLNWINPFCKTSTFSM